MSRTLTYPDIVSFMESGLITLDYDEKIFEGLAMDKIVEMDEVLRDRCFGGRLLTPTSDFNSARDLLLHSKMPTSFAKTLAGSIVLRKEIPMEIPLNERISVLEQNTYTIVSVPQELNDVGVRMLSPSMLSPGSRIESVVLAYYGKAKNFFLQNDSLVLNARFITII